MVIITSFLKETKHGVYIYIFSRTLIRSPRVLFKMKGERTNPKEYVCQEQNILSQQEILTNTFR